MRTLWKPMLFAAAIAMLIAAVTLFIVFKVYSPTADNKREFKPQYVIADWDGQVAVFEGEQDYPMQIYDTVISTLPAELQQAVQAGIPARDAAHLATLLEDYTS